MAVRNSSDFFRILPLTSHLVFMGGVFCVFAPLGLLMGSSFVQQRSAGTTLLAFLISGCLAVSWASAFTLSRKWIAGIVLFTVLQMAFYGRRDARWGAGEVGFSWETALTGAGVIVGYILFVVFISGQGRRTMRLQTEMTLARDIHATLVPPIDIDLDEVEATGASHASTEVGGDLIDVVRHDAGTDFLLADVSGHGVKAGVVMSMVKSATRAHMMSPLGLDELMDRLNTVIEQTTSAEMYSTFAGLRIKDGNLQYGLAGHEHVLHYSAAEARVDRLVQRQMPLGLMAGQRYGAASASIAPGDILAVYTDGLNETEDKHGEQLGHDAIEQALVRKADGPLADAREAILDIARRHGEQTDDRTVLLVRVKPARQTVAE